MTALRDLFLHRIAATGPVSVADYMAECLLHPKHGFYATRDPLGAKGDFTTAPEISQMFGEVIGLALAQAWHDRGAPTPFILAELGPGRGTLMADILRATKGIAGFHDAAQVVLVEASPVLTDIQKTTLAGYQATWQTDIGSLPDAPLFLVANEFFDALPVRQFVRDGMGWRERVIGTENNVLAFGLTASMPISALDHRLEDTKDGDLVELCPGATGIMAEIAGPIAARGGAALIVDYGDWRSQGDTFQAIRAHESVDVLDRPGKSDLTAHVDFEALAQAAAPLASTRLTPQGVFLERLGITGRAQALAAHLSGVALSAHIAAHRRLTHPDEMGTLFKVLGLHRNDEPPLPGLME